MVRQLRLGLIVAWSLGLGGCASHDDHDDHDGQAQTPAGIHDAHRRAKARVDADHTAMHADFDAAKGNHEAWKLDPARSDLVVEHQAQVLAPYKELFRRDHDVIHGYKAVATKLEAGGDEGALQAELDRLDAEHARVMTEAAKLKDVHAAFRVRAGG